MNALQRIREWRPISRDTATRFAAAASAVAVVLIGAGSLSSCGSSSGVPSTVDNAGGDTSASNAWAATLPGCNPSSPAVAHRANQQLLSPQPHGGPVPCGMHTGWPTSENRIEVTNTGALIYQPTILEISRDLGEDVGGLRGGFARSFDDGRTWSSSTIETFVGSDSYPLFSSKDNNLYVDHDTGRLFFYLYNPLGAPPACGPGGATIAFSDNDGTSWTVGHDIDHSCSENPELLTAVPRVSTTAGYPSVVYLCGIGSSTGVGGTGNQGYSCSKSINGGHNWLGTTLDGQSFYSGPGKDNGDPYPECAGASSVGGNGVGGGMGVTPLPDGTIVVVVTCGGTSFLSESKDEGASWAVRHPLPHGGSLRADDAGNLYLLRYATAEGGATQLLLSHSVDGGATWSGEKNMLAPNVIAVGNWFFVQGTHAQGQVGHVAVAYFGVRTGNTTADGFITETRNALDDEPVFWSGQVNGTDRPLMYNTSTEFVFLAVGGETGPTNFLHFIGGALSPDGRSVWGSFWQSCGEDFLTDPNCQMQWPDTNPNSSTDGFAGRLVWPPSPPSSP